MKKGNQNYGWMSGIRRLAAFAALVAESRACPRDAGKRKGNMKNKKKMGIVFGLVLGVFGLLGPLDLLGPGGPTGKWPSKRLLSGVSFAQGITTDRGARPDTDTANPVPFINQPLVPEATAPGSSGFTLTVNGWGFVSGSVVDWNGSALATTFVSSSQLTASVPASDIATPSTASVTVVSPSPGGGTSNVDFFQITNPSSSVAFAISTQAANEWTQFMAAADLNGDGKLDLVGNPSGQNAISVRLGNGDGTFQSEVDYPTGCSPNNSLVVRDFNEDGKLDVAVACTGVVSVLLGNGDGTFQPYIQSPIDPGGVATGLDAGDFNGDGKLDLVVGYQDLAGNDVSVLLGNGDGTFQAPVDYATGNEPNGVTVADLNQDGNLDIVAANFAVFAGNTVSVLLGNGDGTFQPQVEYTTSSGALNVIAADFNGDGKLDLAVVCACGNTNNCGNPDEVSILLGNGDGTFQSRVDYPVTNFPVTLSSGDFYGDGKLDLLVADLNTAQVSLLHGNGDGTFGPAVLYGQTGTWPVGIATGDFNGSGKLGAVIGTGAGFTTLLQVPPAPGAVVAPSSLTFSGQSLGTPSAAQTVTLSNTGTAALALSSLAISGANAGDFSQTNTCGASVPVSGSCTISVTFTPSALGVRTGTLTITDNASGSPQTVSLTGTGVSPVAGLAPTALLLGIEVIGTPSAVGNITLLSWGTVNLTLSSISITGANAADFAQINNCPPSLAPGSKCTISVAFTPSRQGSESATLAVHDNALNSPQTVALSGMGALQPTVSPIALWFGMQKVGSASPAKNVLLTNNLSTPLTITSITFTGADAADFTETNPCGASLAAKSHCTISVTFKPAAGGTRTATMLVNDSANNSPQAVVLGGIGQ